MGGHKQHVPTMANKEAPACNLVGELPTPSIFGLKFLEEALISPGPDAGVQLERLPTE
jgi:hypothetical protein